MLWDLSVWAPSTKQGKTAQWQDLCSKGSVQGLRASFRFPSLSGSCGYIVYSGYGCIEVAKWHGYVVAYDAHPYHGAYLYGDETKIHGKDFAFHVNGVEKGNLRF